MLVHTSFPLTAIPLYIVEYKYIDMHCNPHVHVIFPPTCFFKGNYLKGDSAVLHTLLFIGFLYLVMGVLSSTLLFHNVDTQTIQGISKSPFIYLADSQCAFLSNGPLA